VRQLFDRTSPAFGKREQSTALGLNGVLSTLYFLFLLVVDLQVLLESLLRLLTLRIILLQILAKVDQMDLDLEVALADVLLLRFEVFLVSKDDKRGTSWTLTFAPRRLRALRTFSYATRATLSPGRQFRIGRGLISSGFGLCSYAYVDVKLIITENKIIEAKPKISMGTIN